MMRFLRSTCQSILTILIVAQTGSFAVQAQGDRDVRLLEPGKPVERELAGETAHSYRITLNAGQYINIVVEQKGVDVVVRLFGPDGQQIIEVDSPIGPQGPESVLAIAEIAGDYRLEVRCLEKNVAGRYQIDIVDTKQATAIDRDRVAGEQAMAEAEGLRLQTRVASRQAAIEKLQKASQLFNRIGEREKESESLRRTGTIYHSLGEYEKAQEFYDRAVEISRTASDIPGQIKALNNCANLANDRGDLRKALNVHLQVLALFQASSAAGRIAITFNNICGVYRKLGEYQKALDSCKQALQEWEKFGDWGGRVAVLHQASEIYSELGEFERALDFLNQGLRIILQQNKSQNSLVFLGNYQIAMSRVYILSGEYEKALASLNEALALSKEIGGRALEAQALSLIGKAYNAMGNGRKALDIQKQALQRHQSIGGHFRELEALIDLGDTSRSIAENQDAVDFYNQALSLSRSIRNPQGEIMALYGFAQTEYSHGDFKGARSHLEAALSIIEQLRTQVARQELRTSYFASLSDLFALYIDTLGQLHRQAPSDHYDSLAFEASERARARSLLDLLSEGGLNIREGVDAQLLDREKSLRQEIHAKAQYRTKLLSGKPNEKELTAVEDRLKDLTAQYDEVEGTIRRNGPRYAALTQPQPLNLKEIQQQLLDPDTLLLEYSLGNEHSYLWVISQMAITSFDLGKRAEIETAARRVYELLTALQRAAKSETPRQRQARLAQAEANYAAASANLSQLILAPAAALLGQKRLVIVADGALQYVPFAALPVPGDAQKSPSKIFGPRPLITDHEILSLPSASVLAVIRRETARRAPAAKGVAVFADPVFDKDDDRVQKRSTQVAVQSDSATTISKRALRDVGLLGDGLAVPRLPFTRQEAEAIAALAPADATLKALGFKANLATARSSELNQYRVVHFATHALVNANHPHLSGLLLSLVDEQGQPQDGFLSLNEIYNLSLPADLVVLSACQTAVGKEMRGEGLIGLTRGFMYAGARRVVASLWKVDDAATAELVKRFYRLMLKEGKAPAAALRAAQLEMARQKLWSAPFYWAGFILQGEWK